MYITSKHFTVDRTVRPTTVGSVVDQLFAGTLEIETPIEYVPIEPIRTIRTKTVWSLTPTTDTVNPTTFAVAMRNIIDIAARHPNPETEYIHFRIPKKTHGFRQIDAPKEELSKDLKEISNILTYKLKMLSHDSAWAYIKGRDVVGAIQEHANNGSHWFLKLDLHDFFGSCNADFIKEQLFNLYPFALYENNPTVIRAVDEMIRIATLNGGLPQGTPLSPILTNLIMISIDYHINKAIYNLTKDESIYKQKYIYTRYADDILISAKHSFEYEKVIAKIQDILNDTPLTINEEKTRYASNSGRNWNLGVMYNKDNKITVGYKRKNRIKVSVYNFMTNRENWSVDDVQYLLGQLSWLHNVEPDYYESLMTYFRNKYHKDIKQELIYILKNS